MITKILRVKLNERVVLFKNGLPRRALIPGRYRLWGSNFTEQRFSTDQLLLAALPEVRAILPNDWYREVSLTGSERGVLSRDGVPQVYLRPGVHRFWTIDPSVALTVFDLRQPFPLLTEALERVIPSSEFVSATVRPFEQALLIKQGRVLEVVGPGQYRMWNTPDAKVSIEVIDMRRTEVTIAGQDLMTRDKVTLRLTLVVEYAIEDPIKAQRATSVRDSLYVAAQLAARDFVAGVTLDELLEGRDRMTQTLADAVLPTAVQLGARLERVGVKDVVLPGEMKALLNRVIEAEKEAQANVILRREETAATRSLANTARVMAQEPILLRLKELDAMKDIASRIQEVRVVVGVDGLSALLPAQLLTGKVG
jgi:regulator of protease activity HflC (stomatin/prohibitin superfamily)